MPRAATSPTGRIVNFFRTADLETAKVVLDLCKDALTERRQKSEQARARAKENAKPSAPAATARPAKKKAAAKKKTARRPARRRPTDVRLPLGEDRLSLADNGEAGDLPA